MFLLGIGELLEDWTHKKSVGDLARIMSLNVEKVWLKTEDGEILVPYSQIKQGDSIVCLLYTSYVSVRLASMIMRKKNISLLMHI